MTMNESMWNNTNSTDIFDSLIIQDHDLNMTTLTMEVTTQTTEEPATTYLPPVYTPTCSANATNGTCQSCMRNPFFWITGPNGTARDPPGRTSYIYTNIEKIQ